MSLFDVESTAVRVLGYPLSWIELIGTVCYFVSVWFAARRNILTWPVGIVASIFYLELFRQIGLYADSVENVYYVGACVFGWVRWGRPPPAEAGRETRFSSPRGLVGVAGAAVVLSLLAWAVLVRAHAWWPLVFPAPASYPLLDGATTVMSFFAIWLMARRRTESWIYWIVVDVIGIGLYYVKDVRFVALQYVALLAMAIAGFLGWRRAGRGASGGEGGGAGLEQGALASVPGHRGGPLER